MSASKAQTSVKDLEKTPIGELLKMLTVPQFIGILGALLGVFGGGVGIGRYFPAAPASVVDRKPALFDTALNLGRSHAYVLEYGATIDSDNKRRETVIRELGDTRRFSDLAGFSDEISKEIGKAVTLPGSEKGDSLKSVIKMMKHELESRKP